MRSVKEMQHRSPEEKKKILDDIERLGVVAGCRHHGIYASTYYQWLRKFKAHGMSGLTDGRKDKTQAAALNRLEKENQLLKEMVADRDLELKMKDELLKKKMAQWRQEKKW